MKGLFIKDLRLLKGQKTFFISILIMMVIFMVTYENYNFVICYITIMMGVLTLTTISYDEYENGMSYLFTLPVSRKKYVGEKYLFSIVTTILGTILVSLTALIVSRVRNVTFSLDEGVLSVIASFLIVTIMLSLLLPMQLKLGPDKSRVGMMMVYGGGFLIGYLVVKICNTLGIDWMGAIDKIAALKPAVSLTGIVVICGILMVVSYLFSLRFLMKREF